MRRPATVLLAGLLGLLATVMPAHAVADPTVQFEIPAPALLPFHDGLAFHDWRDCQPAQIKASARTIHSTYGVLGVVHLHSTHCLFTVKDRLVALLDAADHPLHLTIRDAGKANQGQNPEATSGPTNSTSWGFAWRGPWCAADAVYVRVRLRGGQLLRIPLPGGKPACTQSKAQQVVIRGSYGATGEPVQTAPPEWSSLKAKLAVDPTISGSSLTGVSVTFTNKSPNDISLDPCPNYRLEISSKNAATATASRELSGCPTKPKVVPAHESITVDLADISFKRKEFGSDSTKVTVTFGMAGLTPSAVQSRLA